MIPGIVAQNIPAAGGGGGGGGATSTLSPNWRSPRISLSGGNLVATKDGTTETVSVGSIDAKTSGSWYFEVTINNLGGSTLGRRLIVAVGHANWSVAAGETFPSGTAGYGCDGSNAGLTFVAGQNLGTGFGSNWAAGDVIGVAVNAGARTVRFRRNADAWTSDFTLAGSLPIMPLIRMYTSGCVATFNFGATAFAQTPPSGFSAWSKNANYQGRYWRRQAFLGAGAGESSAEINFRATVGGSNLSRAGGVATASSTFSGFPPSNAFDGNNSTFWSSNGEQGSAWLQFDFGSSQTVREIVETKRASSDQALREGAYQYSPDGSLWFPARAVVETWTNAQETKSFAVCDG